jgi:hypothetical protein
MPLIVDIPEGSVRLNYLFNRLEISHDQRETWSILFEDENDSLGTIDGLTYHRGELFIVTELGVYSSPVSPIDFKLICPQRKGGDMVDIVSFDNMLYACTNNAVYQAASGSRWRLKYEGKGCGHFFSLLNFNGTLLTACEKASTSLAKKVNSGIRVLAVLSSENSSHSIAEITCFMLKPTRAFLSLKTTVNIGFPTPSSLVHGPTPWAAR